MKPAKSIGVLLAAAMIVLCAAFDAAAASRFEIKKMIIEEARDTLVPIELALAVAKVESDFNADALSSAGARGVMQIMPKTARDEFGVQPDDLWQAQTNIRLGVRFLAKLHQQYGGDWELALSHYNGGTIKDNKPHNRTRKYVANVQRWQQIYQEQARLWEDETLQDADYGDDAGVEFADLRPWQVRERADWEEEEVVYERVPEPEIVFVERHYRRPPPPPRRQFGGFGHHRPPRPYFH